MEALPRDLQLHIVRKMDIDARRALGIFFKLRIPDTLKQALGKIFRPVQYNFTDPVAMSEVRLGNGRYTLIRTLYPTHMDEHIIHRMTIIHEDGEEYHQLSEILLHR